MAVTIRYLRAEVLMDSSRMNQEASWQLGAWRVYPESNELADEGGRRVRIEDRAMRVLELLHANAGRVVSTHSILDRIWAGKVVSQHSVATVISELRKTLGGHFIETVPKRGYRLIVAAQARPRPWPLVIGIAASLTAVAIVAFVSIERAGSAGSDASRSVDSGITARYVRARELWSRREHEAVVEARRLLTEIVTEDPRFAPAHAALADIYAHKTGEDLGLPEMETFREAQRHLDAARALDARMPELDVTQALLDFYRDHQPRKGLASVETALAKDSSFAYAWQTRAMLLSALGEHDEALRAIARARELDPVSSSIGWDEVWFVYLSGDAESAMHALERETRTSGPNPLFRALVLDERGDHRTAIEAWLERLVRREAPLSDPEAIRGIAARGAMAAAYRELFRQTTAAEGYEESPVVLALWQYRAGDARGALERLRAAPPDRRSWLTLWAREIPPLNRLLRSADQVPTRSRTMSSAPSTT
jgi:DNA-binding winged helix-turn-helix (wHTH) protein/Tfp pilus assembly protein PilF